MQTTARLLAPGLAKRSLEEAKKFAKLAISQNAIHGRFPPEMLLDFSDPETIPQCKIMSDAQSGGFSSSSLEFVPNAKLELAHTRFHGAMSMELPRNSPEIQRTGYVGWRNKDRPPTIFGRSLWDFEPYIFLALRVKSDGRKYFVNLQTESVVPTDIHQHRLHTRKVGEWETIFIEFNSFVRTNHGEVVEPQSEIMKHKVRTLGMSLTDRLPGPFDIAISKVWVTNTKDDEEMIGDTKP